MNERLRQLLARRGGVAARAELLAAVPDYVLRYGVQAGHLARVFPGIYADPARAVEPRVRAVAALVYAGPVAALSHVTGLAMWRLPGGDLAGPVHVLVPWTRRPRVPRGIVVHRRTGFQAGAPEVLVRDGLPTCRLECCVVDSWPLLARDAARAAVIGAVGNRLTTPARLRSVVDDHRSLPGRQELLRLVSLLDQGCRSELELWGYERIFVGPGLPALERNVRTEIGGRAIYLDVYCPEARVNFELDGAKWHASAADRERDLRRDAMLAARGIMVVRFTHDQLVRQPEWVRAQIRAIVAHRLTR